MPASRALKKTANSLFLGEAVPTRKAPELPRRRQRGNSSPMM
jgi:hypothetical protein